MSLLALSGPALIMHGKYVKLSRETHEVIQNAVVPGSFFVDVFPARTYRPPPGPARLSHAHVMISQSALYPSGSPVRVSSASRASQRPAENTWWMVHLTPLRRR